jgi:Protein of unknown function (DUF3761)
METVMTSQLSVQRNRRVRRRVSALAALAAASAVLVGCNDQPATVPVSPIVASHSAAPSPAPLLAPTFSSVPVPQPTATSSAPAPATQAPAPLVTTVAPPAAHAPDTGSSCGADSYVNVDGNCVHRPTTAATAPAGATAQCVDGTYSFSQHRQGTCSHHGGVATWL